MTEMQAAIGREQLKTLDAQIIKRNFIANLYLVGLKNYYQKYNIFKKPYSKCETCPLKQTIKKCTKCVHAYYRLNLFINNKKINKINLIHQINKNDIECSVGSCPEIYQEKLFKKSKNFSKKILPNAKFLGKASIMFPINPYKSIKKINSEINCIKKILNKFI
jgi:dTDP-4-amino-4,6-dideoxygalactose transaminase